MITIAIPYYDNPAMLTKHLQYLREYPARWRDEVEIIIVDDGSPQCPAEDAVRQSGVKVGVRLFRVLEDIPWNISGALNLAFHYAKDGWVFSSAVDHVLPVECVDILLQEQREMDPAKFYQFIRYNVDEHGQHTVSSKTGHLFYLTRQLFWQVGGYDEDFAGWYGAVGHLFDRALNKKSEKIVYNNIYVLHFGVVVPDPGSERLGRQDGPRYWKNSRQMKQLFRNRRKKYNPTNPLRFEWTEVI